MNDDQLRPHVKTVNVYTDTMDHYFVVIITYIWQ